MIVQRAASLPFPIFERCAPYVDRFLRYLKVIEGSWLTVYGTVELATRVTRSYPEQFKESARIYRIVHGTLFTLSGLAAFGCAALQFGLLPLENLFPLLHLAEDGGFALANLYMLWHYMDLYAAAESIGDSSLKRSALCGIGSAIGYLFGMAASLFGCSSALIFLFICIGMGSGGLKILFDFIN